MTTAAAETTTPASDDDLDIPVTVDDGTTAPAANDTVAKPATLADRIAAAEASAKRQREQKRASVQKQRELQADRDRLAKEHETTSARVAKVDAAVKRFLEDGDESALEELGLPADLYQRLGAARIDPERTKLEREGTKKERELAKQIADLKAAQDKRDEDERNARAEHAKATFLKAVRDNPEMDDLHVYDDERLLKWGIREATKLKGELRREPSFEEIVTAVHAHVTPHHARVIDLHAKREAKKAEAAKATGGKKPVDDEPRGLTGDLSAQRGGPQPKAKDADELRERMVKKLADKLAEAPAPTPKKK